MNNISEIKDIFTSFSETIEKEGLIREDLLVTVKALEKTVYAACTIMEKIHNCRGFLVSIFY